MYMCLLVSNNYREIPKVMYREKSKNKDLLLGDEHVKTTDASLTSK